MKYYIQIGLRLSIILICMGALVWIFKYNREEIGQFAALIFIISSIIVGVIVNILTYK